jgi:hypothetical protein
MYEEVLLPIVNRLKLEKIEFVTGYRSTNYYVPTTDDEFIFVNIGMFAVLQDVESVKVAEICNPNETIIITSKEDENIITDYEITHFNDKKNILNSLPFQKITLAGIADSMPFVTPKDYLKEKIDELIENINRLS